jgi:competence protein ComEA
MLRGVMRVVMLFVMTMAGASAAVDANRATQAQLREVPGIGPAIAERIVKERRRGPYRDTQDLRERVRGVGEANLRRMVDGGLVVTDAPATGEGAAKNRGQRMPERKAGGDATSSTTAVGKGVLIERAASASADAPAAPPVSDRK